MPILERERRGRVELLRLNRPEARNAMSGELSATIEAALDEVEADRDVAAVVTRSPTASAIAPCTTLPIGYSRPRRRSSALSTRPRSAAGARSWAMVVKLDRQPKYTAPTRKIAAAANASVGAAA